jgi:hypothetical protein
MQSGPNVTALLVLSQNPTFVWACRRLLPKRKSYTAPNRATLVTEHLYFHFFGVPGEMWGNKHSNRADRQNAHSGSIAVNALIQLYRASSRVEELDRKILAFSISGSWSSLKKYCAGGGRVYCGVEDTS